MRDIEAEITIWTLPHRAYGSVVAVDLEAEEENVYFLYRQSLKGVPFKHSSPCVDVDYPFEKIALDKNSVLELGSLIESFKFEFDEPYYPTKLGSTNYGLEISRGFQKVAIRWTGSEHINNATKQIYDFLSRISSTT